MRHFEINDEMEGGKGWMLGDITRRGGPIVDDWHFTGGVPWESSEELVVGLIEEGGERHISFTTYDAPVVSEEMRRILESVAPSAVQFIPVSVESSRRRFWIANVLDVVECLDESRSHVERFEPNDPVRPDRAGEISLVLNLQIDPLRAADHHLFRVKGYVTALVASERVRKQIVKGGIKGLEFTCVTPEA